MVELIEAGIMKQSKRRTTELTKANTYLQNEITKRLRMEIELEAERNKLRSILNAMDDGVCLVSDNYDVEYVNPVLEREFGLANGRKCYDYFHDKREICEWCKNKEVFAGKSVRWEWHSFKTKKTYDLYDTSVVNSDGSLSKLEFLHDVTERKKTEEILKNYQKELRSLAAELSIVEERERRSVATDIHDNIGQSLAAAKIKLGLIRQSLTSTDAAGTIDQIAIFIDEAINYTQSLIINLSLPTLYDVDFAEAVEWLCDLFRERYGIPINFDKDGEINPIKDETRVILFKCVRELLNNIVKHSNAQRVNVSIRQYNTDIITTVEDDGIGFDINQLKKRFVGNGGFGLFSIRERLHHLSGQMTIQSKTGNGTLITLKAPLKYTPERL
jgi:PAS domain S-box-containing protein